MNPSFDFLLLSYDLHVALGGRDYIHSVVVWSMELLCGFLFSTFVLVVRYGLLKSGFQGLFCCSDDLFWVILDGNINVSIVNLILVFVSLSCLCRSI